jgi:hypothetical protein
MQGRLIAPIASHVSANSGQNNTTDGSRLLSSSLHCLAPQYNSLLHQLNKRTQTTFGSEEVANRFRQQRLGYSRIVSFANSVPSFEFSWPPSVESRDEWIGNGASPLVPPGKGSIVALSRLYMPVFSFRLAVLGRSYLEALLQLGLRDEAGNASECSWPRTESSFLLVENDDD